MSIQAQTRENLFKNHPQWKCQQRILWTAGRGKNRFKIQELFADERRSRMVLDFLAASDVGRQIPDAAEHDAQSEASD